jgi:hypothetical protein
MQVKSTLEDSYSLQFFELLESYHLAQKQKLKNNKKYYLIDHISEDYPPGYDYYFVENDAEHLNYMGNARKFIDNGSADLLLGSFLHPKHKLYNRTVSLPRDYINCNLWYTHPYYFTSNLFVDKPRDKNLGFTSIIELCPKDINNFDTELDHVKRIGKIAQCCEWIQDNLDVFDSAEANDILKKNYENFHKPAIIVKQAVKTFEKYL